MLLIIMPVENTVYAILMYVQFFLHILCNNTLIIAIIIALLECKVGEGNFFIHIALHIHYILYMLLSY